ncbi:TSPAN12 [Branchiostoma lanceolatum]|uniref:Tetraspanin n=1 Tax=Branchiostoma lanceolatum TaxID=7740 RepID=A0A8K0EPP9_BRALA|nr:TSPAN12 [Branchiostoma lanceolatum]
MAVEDCIRCVKCLLFAFNVLFWIIGLAIVAVGTWVRDHVSALISIGAVMEDTGGGYFVNVYYPVIVTASCVMILVGFLGCCGAMTENPALLGKFLVCLMLIFFVELGGGLWAYKHPDEDPFPRRDDEVAILSRRLRFYGDRNYGEVTKGWDFIQNEYHCCGMNSYRDWYRLPAWPSQTWVPDSCCRVPAEGCGHLGRGEDYFSQGCSFYVLSFFEDSRQIKMMKWLGVSMGVIQMMSMMLTLLLCIALCCNNFRMGYFQAASRPVDAV